MSSQTRPNVEIRSASSSLPSQKLHLFPVGINYSGPARVSDFLVLQNASGDIVEFGTAFFILMLPFFLQNCAIAIWAAR